MNFPPLHAVPLRALIASSLLVAIATTAVAAEPKSSLSAENRYLDVVRQTVDALLKHGVDQWGDRKTAMIASVLDRKKLAPPQKLPQGSIGVRESDRTNTMGSNANMQQNLYLTMQQLAKLTDEARYGKAAEAAMIDFVRNTQSPGTHLLGWGEHLFYDMQAEKTATNSDAGRATLIHEIKKPLEYWDLLYKAEPERMLNFARGLWEHQISDHKTGDFSRHANWDVHKPGHGYDFTKEAGYMIEIWSRAYAEKPELVLAEAMNVLVERYTGKLNKLNLLDYDGRRPEYCNNGHNVTLAMECHAAAERIGDAEPQLVKKLRSLAERIDAGFLYCRHAPDDVKRGFIATCTTSNGESRDREGPGPGGHSVLWGFGYGKQTTAMIGLHCYHRLHQLPEGPTRKAYHDLMLAAARTYENAKLPAKSEQVDVWAVEPGVAISLLIAAHRETDESRYLEAARRLADESIAAYWSKSSPLPRASLLREHYEAMTGADTLLRALLTLHMQLAGAGQWELSDLDR
ncbi:MAG: hypothetical protein QM775_23595 [Pirellulales bacterium]